MRIPNCEKAIVPIEKLRDYCLSDTHPKGKHKARVFYSALGLTQKDAETLRSALLAAICDDLAGITNHDEYGQRYTLDFVLVVNGKTATVRSAWIILNDENQPRLVTCFVL